MTPTQMKAVRDLRNALAELTPPMPPEDASCHVNLVPQGRCCNCGRIARAHAALKYADTMFGAPTG